MAAVRADREPLTDYLRSPASACKQKVATAVVNIAEACTRKNFQLKLIMDSRDSASRTWVTLAIDASTRPRSGEPLAAVLPCPFVSQVK